MAITTKNATIGYDMKFTQLNGVTIDAGSVAAGATVAVTVDHSANQVFNLNTVPELQVSSTSPVTNATVAVGEIHPDRFVVNVTNNSAAAGHVSFDWQRVGL